jgi:hypothetical protein
VFISGARGLFHLTDYWNAVPNFLREHGYDVMVLEPPSRGDRIKAILQALDSIENKCHLIADQSQEAELTEIARHRHPNAATLNLVVNRERFTKTQEQAKHRLSAHDLRPLESAITIFELGPLGPAKPHEALAPLAQVNILNLQKQRASQTKWLNFASKMLLALHNRFAQKREAQIDPWETGAVFTIPDWLNEKRFLDLAISLAERDAQWCD